jgi:flagellar motility protein MotE (MotC chaperone)
VNQGRLLASLAALLVLGGMGMVSIPFFHTAMAANPAAPQGAPTTTSPSRTAVADGKKSVPEESAAIEIRRQQLVERESALAAKEQELKKAAAGLDAKLKELTELKKAFDEAMKQKKTEAAARQERYKKMLKVFRGLKPVEAGKLIDNLEEDLAIEMLNQMDQKTAIKLIPYLNQPRVLKWARLNLKGTEL